MIFTSILDAGDQWIMAKIHFYTNFPMTPKISKKKKVFWMIFQLPPRSKMLFGVSKLIEFDIFEGFWMRFEAQKVILTSILDAGDQWIMAKIRFYTNAPSTSPNKRKRLFFHHFSNFLQIIRFCLGHQNTSNQAYLLCFYFLDVI